MGDPHAEGPENNIIPGDDEHYVDRGEKLNKGEMITDSTPINVEESVSNDDLSDDLNATSIGCVKDDDLMSIEDETTPTPSSIGRANQLPRGSRVFEISLKGVSGKFKLYFRKYQRSFKEV